MMSKKNAEHYVWGQQCDGWFLEQSQERIIIHERMPAGTSEVRHMHEKASQFFFMLSGIATMELDGENIQLHAHEGVTVLPGVPHQMRNDSEESIEFLVISTPTTKGDRYPV
ncbi:cupin domain-containing protein [Paenibacillus hexagrammi]|uniref:Cupin domain-containing protein n=1 Tax=Paenibacillus hexagrammi TaxID=2908839 RepID=A0ABY3SHU4_9BACL|nr:cupin domain-containing protein [Paenibacillus sp. YPD9-1]UJF33333.1 cupin domain-containing protein [Paenibacillus sp. YPD9-1]